MHRFNDKKPMHIRLAYDEYSTNQVVRFIPLC